MNPIYVDQKEILKRYKPIEANTHKGIQGHALIIAGSYGKIGAAVMASCGCLKTGCDLVTAFVPKYGYQIVQIATPEVLVVTDMKKKHLTAIAFEITTQAIGIGPGIGQKYATQKAVHEFLLTNNIPLVVDADALNILSKKKS